MRETQEDIDNILSITGEDLVFSGGTIKGVPMQQVYNLENLSSPYDVEKQEVSFWVSQKDFYDKSLAEGTEFTYVVLTKTYTFTIISYVFDFLGFVELKVYVKVVA